MAFKAVNSHGMDADIAARMNAKYDKNLENDLQAWMEKTTGITFDQEFGEMLKSGVVLCELVNALMPGKIKKINKTGGLFRLQENITNFLRVCREVGVAEASLFPTESLAQLKDLNQVLTCVNAFKNVMEGKGKSTGGAKFTKAKPAEKKETGKKKSKWTVKPGGTSGVSLLNQGSAAVMERSKYTDARENIKRDGKQGAGTNEVSMLNQGSAAVMERSKYTDARENIKRDGKKGAGTNEVSMLNQGSAAVMERQKYTDAREQIKREELDGKGTEGTVSALNQGSAGMERQKYTDAREQIKRGEL